MRSRSRHLEEGFTKVVNKQETTVAKDYAAGDVDTDRHYVVLAVASGAVAAISIYEDILKKALKTIFGLSNQVC